MKRAVSSEFFHMYKYLDALPSTYRQSYLNNTGKRKRRAKKILS
jgi:hypothetical protein